MGHCGAVDLGEKTAAEIELEIHQLIPDEVRIGLFRAEPFEHVLERLEMSAWVAGGNGPPQLRRK